MKIIEFIFLAVMIAGLGRLVIIVIFFDLQYPKKWFPILIFLLIGFSEFKPYITYAGFEIFEEEGALRLWLTRWKWARYRRKEGGRDRTLIISRIS